jgi:D-alanyl-D-alanine carboxypeptidase/D-alanyl-D-alanine-endopeptidase (penicillin-binding protein 4)
LFAERPTARRLPASVEKLYTTVTALFTLGADARLTTTVLGDAAVSADGTYHGALYLRGGGDPTFGDQGFDQEMYGTGVGATVEQLVKGLKAAGIRRVSGPIVADESYLDSRRGGPNSGYKASTVLEGELSGLAYDDGFTSSGETQLQTQPALWAGEALATMMRQSGIVVPKAIKVRTGVTPAAASDLAQVQSPPLSTLIELTNSPSDDFFAETLLKDIGKHSANVGSTAAGAAVVRSVIARKLGLHPTLDDGSGLSRRDRTTAAQVVTLLREMRDDPAFYDSLAIAGIRGTMAEEMLKTRAADNCRGKTGTLHDVANLVGYCTAANGDQLAFAFLMNDLHNSTTGHELEDLMGEALANYAP